MAARSRSPGSPELHQTLSDGGASSGWEADTESKINWWDTDDDGDSLQGDTEASWCKKGEIPKDARQVSLFNPDPKRCNRIRTTHYSWYSFVPMVLFEQFSQPANAYFLVIVMLQMIPAISNTGGLPLTVIPLTFVVGVSALKDAYEDWRRSVSDRTENNRACRIVDAVHHTRNVKWMDVRPGHLVCVRKGEQIPCDGLLIASNLPGGECFVQTMNLDGETNLKKKAAALTEEEWEEVQQVGEDVQCLQLECEPPSVDLYKFNGAVMTATGAARGVSIGSLLLRGTQLMQTEWVLCMAIFCGHDTRAMMNAQSARYKLSKMDVELSKVVYMLFACQLGVCMVLAAAAMIWYNDHADAWYLERADDQLKVGIIPVSYGTWLLLTCNTVPISLMVTLTVVKFIQCMFIFFDSSFGKQGAGVHTSQVVESLGQITHIFSDKTGTLTRNLMVYKACSVGGRMYGIDEDGSDLPFEAGRIQVDHVDFHSAAFRRDLFSGSVEAGASSDGGRPGQLATFLLIHAVCHTVSGASPDEDAVDQSPGSSSGNDRVCYDASSPDELALVSLARAMGLEFVHLRHGRAQLIVHGAELGAALEVACGWRGVPADGSSITGGELIVDVLDIIEFDNERKRMSTVVRFPDGRLVLLMKGADTSVLPQCVDVGDQKTNCEEHLWRFATRGLRTLCFAMCMLGEDEYQTWHARYLAAQKMFSEERFMRVQQLASEIETRPMTLLGATAIEDLLQEGVPETIEQFRGAGIRVWVLTGDKVETAISIALSCKLLTEDMNNQVIDGSDAREVHSQLKQAGGGFQPSLTITGVSLAVALERDWLRELLFQVAEECCAVICCRVSPKQKADVVLLVKTMEAAAVTLSIGDGANDVSMIITAHVGVGIAGKEGGQAASTADFAFEEFRHLRRLLFVHGRESYRRMSVLSLYNFYKNIALVLPLVLSSAGAGYTGQNIFHPWLVQVHNIIYSHAAVCFYGIFDRVQQPFDDLELDVTNWGVRQFSRSAILIWVLIVFLQAMFYIEVATRALPGCTKDGGVTIEDASFQGNLIFVWAEMGVNITMYFRHRTWYTWMSLPYMFNLSMLFLSLAITNYEHHGFAEGVLSTIFTSNILRVFLATLLAMMGHILIGELFITWDASLARPISRLGRRVLEQCGFPTPEPEVTKINGYGEFQMRHMKSVASRHSAMMMRVKEGMGYEKKLEQFRLNRSSTGEVAMSELDSASTGANSTPTTQFASRGSRGTGSFSRRPGSMVSLGFAFSEECFNEREQGRHASRAGESFRKSIMRASLGSIHGENRRHSTSERQEREHSSLTDVPVFERRRCMSLDAVTEIELSTTEHFDLNRGSPQAKLSSEKRVNP